MTRLAGTVACCRLLSVKAVGGEQARVDEACGAARAAPEGCVERRQRWTGTGGRPLRWIPAALVISLIPGNGKHSLDPDDQRRMIMKL